MMGWGAEEQAGWRKGPWTAEEDKLLSEYLTLHGEGRWSSVARSAGLNRSGKSCRLRWVNYLKPGLKKGHITPLEEGIIIELHALLGNKWSTIARYLPGRTDNEIKNYWRTHFKKKERTSQMQRKRKDQFPKRKQPQQQPDQLTTTPLTELLSQLMAFTYPSEGQCVPTMSQDGTTVVSWSDQSTVEDGLWDSLWNLDYAAASDYCDKTACVPNHGTPLGYYFGDGGDSDHNFYVNNGSAGLLF